MDAKVHVSIAAAKRAEALAKVLAAERVQRRGRHSAQKQAAVGGTVTSESDSHANELARKVHELRSRNARDEAALHTAKTHDVKLEETTASLKAQANSYK